MPFGDVGGLHSISTANGLTAATVTFTGESDGTVEQIFMMIITQSMLKNSNYTIFQCGLCVTGRVGESVSGTGSNTAGVCCVWTQCIEMDTIDIMACLRRHACIMKCPFIG